MMVYRRKLIIIGACISFILIVVAVILFIGYRNNVEVSEQLIRRVELRLFDGENNYSLEGTSDGKLYFYVNNDKVEDLGYYNTLHECLELLDSSTVVAKDITENKLIMDLTWESSIVDSSGYIKFLQNDGWKIIRQANTYSYIEVFMQKDDVIKRLIITNTFIMQGDLTLESVLPDLNTYFNSYGLKYSFK